MVSQKTRLIAAALITGIPFRAAVSQEPFSGLWFALLLASLLSAILLVREYRQYQAE
ncbi:hypothetical protein SAMN04487950_1114 [Halogranum rubrum]|uniref:Uncharacterized protein n=1 Tax=Halogranum rubrum TaxID=553466 RepID=A0A1I4CDI0_9EURY|nr:hypothetical protein SAMN04487950_1114 [Halogranum rubrum]